MSSVGMSLRVWNRNTNKVNDKKLLNAIEQNITICLWQADQLFDKAKGAD